MVARTFGSPRGSSLRVLRDLSLLCVAAGCGPENGRPGAPEVLLPDQVPVVWDLAYNGIDDGLGALVPVDVMAYDGSTGRPMAGLEVHVWTADAAAMPIQLDRVTVLGDQMDTGALPFTGRIPFEEPGPYAEPVALVEFWDAVHDQFVALSPVEDIDLVTDSGGIARLYLFVDAFPVQGAVRGAGDDGLLAPIQVVAAVGDEETVFSLVPR